MKNILVLSSGGFASGFQVGAYSRMVEEENYRPDAVFGISGGAINGSMIACGKFEELKAYWQEVANDYTNIYTSPYYKGTHFSPIMFVLNPFYLFKNKAFGSNKKLISELAKNVKKENIVVDEFSLGLVTLDNSRFVKLSYTDFLSDADLVKGVVASASIPMVFPAVNKIATTKGILNNAYDGGIKVASPLSMAVDYSKAHPESEYSITIINCSDGEDKKRGFKKSLVSIASKSIAGIYSQTLQKDVELFKLRNNSEGFVKFRYRVIEPTVELPSSIDMSYEAINFSINEGANSYSTMSTWVH